VQTDLESGAMIGEQGSIAEGDVTAIMHHDRYPVERHVALHAWEIIVYTGNYCLHTKLLFAQGCDRQIIISCVNNNFL
jgi:hypothetical protein